MNKKGFSFFPILIILLALLSFGRVLFFPDVNWDDNCLVLSIYTSKNLIHYVNTVSAEVRRPLMGIFLYYFLGLHKSLDYFFIIGQGINIFIQFFSPLVLYYFIKNLFKNNLFAFLIASSFIILHKDTTIPCYSIMVYRVGVMLSIISFYLTERGLAKGVRWKLLLAALFLSFLSHYFFMEGTINYELARLLLIYYIFSMSNEFKDKVLIKKTLLVWAPFITLCIPLIIYKLLYKPYGIYAGMYTTSYKFLLNWDFYKQLAKYLLFQTWYIYSKYPPPITIWSIGLGFLTLILCLYSFTRLNLNKIETSLRKGWRAIKITFLMGILFFLPPALMYIYTSGRVPTLGSDSRHGIILQIGCSFISGSILYAIYQLFHSSRFKLQLYNISLAMLFGLGVFFNNVSLDLYFKGWEKEVHFWQKFTERFPSLPEKASFLMDVQDDIPFYNAELCYYYVDFNAYYDFELPLNMLYATSREPETFRRYKVYSTRIDSEKLLKEPNTTEFVRPSHWGNDILNTRDFIVVHYRKGELLVNREIIARYPDVAYRQWANKDFPLLPKGPLSYPLRKKISGFK